MIDPKNTKGAVPTSDDIRDVLAITLYDALTDGEKFTETDKETGEVRLVRVTPSASLISQINAYLKQHPPTSVPTVESATGLLARHAKVLPFGKKTGTDN